jgi:hypothetical protein
MKLKKRIDALKLGWDRFVCRYCVSRGTKEYLQELELMKFTMMVKLGMDVFNRLQQDGTYALVEDNDNDNKYIH